MNDQSAVDGFPESLLPPVRCMPDANAYDLIIATPGMVERLLCARDRGLLVLTSIRKIEDELTDERTPKAKRKAFAQVPRGRVPDGAFIAGYSRVGEARVGPGDVYEHVRGEGGLGNVSDALLAETARNDGLILVTHDRRLWFRATEAGVPVINFAAFQRLLDELLRLS